MECKACWSFCPSMGIKRIEKALALVLSLGTVAACKADDLEASTSSIAIRAHAEERTFCGSDPDAIEARIDDLLAQMSLKQKALQMHGAWILPSSDGLWTTRRDPVLDIPGFAMIDGPRGVSSSVGNATAFPVGMARGATWDPGLEERVGEAIGSEARASGASVLLAPTINLLRHPRWGRAQETYGEDPFHLARMGVGFIVGAQRQVIATAKHFAVNSIENTRFAVNVQVDERILREIYLPHFRAAVQEAQVGSVMTAYNRMNGTYCGENPHLLSDILKGEWGFRGFAVSDWFLGTRSTVPAARAGLDIEMPVGLYYDLPIVLAVVFGALDEAVVDEAVRRILRAKLCFALDTNPPVIEPERRETPEHLALALEMARRGIVLLENRGGLLPLDRSGSPRVAVIGPLADVENIGDTGSSAVNPSEVITPLEGLRALAGKAVIEHVIGDPTSPDNEAILARADLVAVFVGLTSDDEGEGQVGAGDRDSLELPAADQELIADVAARSDRVAVVLEGGAAITMGTWADQVEGIVMAWYPGARGGTAIAEILFGDTNPAGRLPIVFPRAESDLPPFDNVSLDVTYDYHGYRHLDRLATEPLYPFGFGLSYTSFHYSNLVAPPTLAADGSVDISFDVTNTGSVAGIETPQLYVSYPDSQAERVVRELKGFARVELEPNETATVTLTLRASDLAFFDTSSGRWVVEAVAHGLHVGSHSHALPLETTINVE